MDAVALSGTMARLAARRLSRFAPQVAGVSRKMSLEQLLREAPRPAAELEDVRRLFEGAVRLQLGAR